MAAATSHISPFSFQRQISALCTCHPPNLWYNSDISFCSIYHLNPFEALRWNTRLYGGVSASFLEWIFILLSFTLYLHSRCTCFLRPFHALRQPVLRTVRRRAFFVLR